MSLAKSPASGNVSGEFSVQLFCFSILCVESFFATIAYLFRYRGTVICYLVAKAGFEKKKVDTCRSGDPGDGNLRSPGDAQYCPKQKHAFNPVTRFFFLIAKIL